MRLHRNLFYIILPIFIIGIVLSIIDIDDGGTFSRVAVGLVTGSFMAGVNALTNYLYLRRRYFSDLITSMKGIGSILFDEYTKESFFVDFEMPSNNDQLRKLLPEYIKRKEQESSKRELQITQCYNQFDDEGFVPLIPFLKSTFYKDLGDWFEELDDLFDKYYCKLPMFIKKCFDKEELLLWEGSDSGTIIPDSYLERCRNYCTIYRGMISYDIVQLSDVCSELKELIKKEILDNGYRDLDSYCQFMRSIVEKEKYYDRFAQEVGADGLTDEERKEEGALGGTQYIVTSNSIQIKLSYLVRKKDFERELVAIHEQHPDCLVWNRSMNSLKREWAAHNAFHALGLMRRQTTDTYLNWPQKWYTRIGYAVAGTIAWPFIK